MKKVRGAYFVFEDGPHVMMDKSLPNEPAIFTMAHELKHHLADQELVSHEGYLACEPLTSNEMIEIGAEIFAAELIFPEAEFAAWFEIAKIGLGGCEPEHLVELKLQSRTTLSYAALAKRSEFLGFAQAGIFKNIKWKKLEESIYGEPLYKQLLRYKKNSASKRHKSLYA